MAAHTWRLSEKWLSKLSSLIFRGTAFTFSQWIAVIVYWLKYGKNSAMTMLWRSKQNSSYTGFMSWVCNKALSNRDLDPCGKYLSWRSSRMDFTAFGPYARNVRRNISSHGLRPWLIRACYCVLIKTLNEFCNLIAGLVKAPTYYNRGQVLSDTIFTVHMQQSSYQPKALSMQKTFVLTFMAHGPHCILSILLRCQNKYFYMDFTFSHWDPVHTRRIYKGKLQKHIKICLYSSVAFRCSPEK